MSARRNPEPVRTAIGGCRLLEQIGKGGMGRVYKAVDPDGRVVAVKLLASHLADNDVQLKRFRQEAVVAQQLDHPNIVRALRADVEDCQPYLIMEYVDGENLAVRVKRSGAIPEEEAVRIIREVAEALQTAHERGLVHRDVKPDNILVAKNGQAKLTDLGLVKAIDSDLNLTQPGKGLGTPHFMAPEQFKNAKNVDPRSDVYALGATLYVLVTGEFPFRGSNAMETFVKKSKNDFVPAEKLNSTLSESTLRAIRRAMNSDPDKRPRSAREFIELLEGKELDAVAAPSELEKSTSDEPMWYVLAVQPDGSSKKLKGPRSAIERQIRKGHLGPGSQASPSKHGAYRRLDEIPEFQQALLGAAAGLRGGSSPENSPPAASLSSTPIRLAARPLWWLAAAAVLAVVSGLAYLFY